MSCDEPRERITAYVDGELDAAEALDFERHCTGCTDCARAVEAEEALVRELHQAGLRYRPAAASKGRLLDALRAAEGSGGVERLPFFRRSWQRASRSAFLAAAALLLVALSSFTLGRAWPGRSGADPLAREVVASHLRSLLAAHLADVEASDRHTVKPWFNGRLDYAVPVIDLAARGFPLRGGRLDYLADQRVAALVYGSDRHVINLFAWPASGSEPASATAMSPHPTTERGLHLVHWQAGGMTYWAVSDLNAGDIVDFAGRFQVAAQSAVR